MADKNSVRSFVAVAVASAAVLCACSSSSGTGATGTSSSPETNASNCPSWTGALDAYGGGVDVVHEGASNELKFELMNIDPPPPELGTMTWILKITDASGQPVKDATFKSIATWMPQHQHPSTAQPVPANNGDGTYTISNLYLYMAGVWQVTFTAQSGTTTDSAQFAFCLGT
jgi:hypothetical protein